MTLNSKRAAQILSLIDLTSLEGSESKENIESLCTSAMGDHGNVAAVCVYPRYVQTAKQTLLKSSGHKIRIATVVNFPSGENSIDEVVKETQWAIEQGAEEIDLVLPYKHLIAGDTEFCKLMLDRCRAACGKQITLKVIIESGVLLHSELITQAANLCADTGADFIKTSTGKVAINATLHAAEQILAVIKLSGRQDLGFKASGGIRTVQQAIPYIELCEAFMGAEWLTTEHFRFGASSLLDDVNAHITAAQSTQSGD